MQLPTKLKPLFQPSRYKIVYGGRGSGKSWGIARVLLIRALQSPLRILCAREFQNSIKESVHKLLDDQIDTLGLSGEFNITNNEIGCRNGSHFFFYGIRNNPTKIKSTEGIDICWIEEAETVSAHSWEILIPTIRKPNSEIWLSFNPREATDPTYVKFIADPPPNSLSMQMNWRDNPWFPDVLREEMELLRKKDISLYHHIWEGQTLERTDAQIFWDKVQIDKVQPQTNWNGPYYGLDWGFSVDPLRMVRCWISNNQLYIDREADGVKIDLHFVVPFLKQQDPYCDRYTIRADNARPEAISYCQQHGLPKMIAAVKRPNSINEGIAFIRSFDNIIIDPQCKKTIEEARLYRYKTDKLTGDILPEVLDAYNHSWDAVRYAIEPMIPTGRPGGIRVFSQSLPKYARGYRQ